MLTVAAEKREHAVYVSLAGRMDSIPACRSLKDTVRDHIDQGDRKFVIDLTEVISISSHGIGCLVSCFVSVQRAEGSMALLAPNDRVLKALTVTRLVPTVFEVIEARAHPNSS